MITIFKPAEVTVTVIDGDPPTDQSATIAALQSQVTALEAERDAAVAQVTALGAERDAALAQVAALQAKIAAALAALA